MACNKRRTMNWTKLCSVWMKRKVREADGPPPELWMDYLVIIQSATFQDTTLLILAWMLARRLE